MKLIYRIFLIKINSFFELRVDTLREIDVRNMADFLREKVVIRQTRKQ